MIDDKPPDNMGDLIDTTNHYVGEKAHDESAAHQALPENDPAIEMSAITYALTRLSTLKPPMNKAPNPISLLRMLNRQQWAFFAVAFAGWVSCRLLCISF